MMENFIIVISIVVGGGLILYAFLRVTKAPQDPAVVKTAAAVRMAAEEVARIAAQAQAGATPQPGPTVTQVAQAVAATGAVVPAIKWWQRKWLGVKGIWIVVVALGLIAFVVFWVYVLPWISAMMAGEQAAVVTPEPKAETPESWSASHFMMILMGPWFGASLFVILVTSIVMRRGVVSFVLQWLTNWFLLGLAWALMLRFVPEEILAKGDELLMSDGLNQTVYALVILSAAVLRTKSLTEGKPKKEEGKDERPPPPPAEKKSGRLGVGASVAIAAFIAFAATVAVVMLAWETSAAQMVVVLPVPYMAYGLVLVGIFAIPRIGPVAALAAGVLAAIAVGTGFLTLQEQSLLLWGKLHLQGTIVSVYRPLWYPVSFLLFFALWFVFSRMISRRRTREVYLIAATFFIYTEFFLLAVLTWK